VDTCTDCGERATCEYDRGTGRRYGCAAHDPMRPLTAATVSVPPYYRTLPPFAVTVTTGHLGVATAGHLSYRSWPAC
jgi:hypothetical protein